MTDIKIPPLTDLYPAALAAYETNWIKSYTGRNKNTIREIKTAIQNSFR